MIALLGSPAFFDACLGILGFSLSLILFALAVAISAGVLYSIYQVIKGEKS